MNRQGIAVIVVLTLLCGVSAVAQTANRSGLVAPGERVRVTTASDTIEGVLTFVGKDALVIRPSDGAMEIRVARTTVRKLERVMGRRSRARYAGFGALIGLGAGALVGAASGCDPDSFLCSTELQAAGGGVVGAIVGAATGAIIPPAPRWVEVERTALTDIPQPIAPPTPAKVRTWALASGTGAALGGPRRELEGAVVRAGFGDTSPGFFGPPLRHPKSGHDIGSFWLEAHRQVGRSWDVGMMYSTTPIGHTYGYHAPSPSQFLFLNYGTVSVAAMVSRLVGPARFGVGPAWYSTWSSEDHTAGRVSSSRAGLVAGGGIGLPVRTRVYLDLSIRYQFVGRADVGPFDGGQFLGAPLSFPAADVPFGHWFISLGPGIRF